MQYESSSTFSQQPAAWPHFQPEESNTQTPLTYLTALSGIKTLLHPQFSIYTHHELDSILFWSHSRILNDIPTTLWLVTRNEFWDM